MKRCVAFVLILLAASVTTHAQSSPGPYLAGQGGALAGDAGGAPFASVAVGYMTPRRLAFELEISLSPDVDLAAPPVSILAIYPAPRFEATGRLLWAQTNAVITLVEGGKLRAAAVAGGGTVNMKREISYSYPTLFTVTPTGPAVVLPPPYPSDFRFSSTETSLSLSAGGIVDYAVTKRLRAGIDARYTHAFFSEPLKQGRVAARAQWTF